MSQPARSLKLYRGWATQGEHVWSPFVIKLEARLRFAGVAYETGAGNPRSAPKGKIPYVEFHGPASAEPTQMGDSTLIIKYLVQTGTLPDLNVKLSPEDKARDLATRALLEDKLYFYGTRERWLDNYYTMRDHAISAIPWLVRIFVGQHVYSSAKAMLYGQGTLRMSDEEAREVKDEVWENISSVLSSVRSRSSLAKNTGLSRTTTAPFWFLGGDEPTEVDATLFGFVVSVLVCTAAPESRKIVKQYPVLIDYAERIHDTYFPDYQKWE